MLIQSIRINPSFGGSPMQLLRILGTSTRTRTITVIGPHSTTNNGTSTNPILIQQMLSTKDKVLSTRTGTNAGGWRRLSLKGVQLEAGDTVCRKVTLMQRIRTYMYTCTGL